MRIILFIITVCCLLISNASQAMTTNEYVSAIEKKLFGITYEKQPMNERVDRIEMQIYDNHYTGNPEERLSKIDKIYPKSEFETGQSQHPQNFTYNNSNDDWYDQDYQEPSKYNNYPIVSEIEQNIYKKNYQGEDIYNRLARLEKELYGNVKNDLSLQERVENLKSALPKKHYDRFADNNKSFNNFGVQNPTEYTSNFDTNLIINELEMETFHKTYKNDNAKRRIDRLEQYYFGATTTGQSDEERLNKIATFALNSPNMNNYFPSTKGAQWAGILMNLLLIGLSFLL